MRFWILVMTLILGMSISAQQQTKLDNIFLRIYNLDGEKIAKGKVSQISSEGLQLKRRTKLMKVNAREVGFIRTKKSKGNTILMGSLIGAGAGATVGAIEADADNLFLPTTTAESAAMGAIAGAFIGAPVGALVSLTKGSEKILINGDPEDWKVFMARFPGN